MIKMHESLATKQLPPDNKSIMLAQRMLSIVWHSTDIAYPKYINQDHLKSLNIIGEKIGNVDIKIVFALTNFIDSIVGNILEKVVRTSIEKLENDNDYSEIKFSVCLQEAAEIVHQKVYRDQFEICIPYEEQNNYKILVTNLLETFLSDINKLNDNQKLIASVSIEAIVIPLDFTVINEIKDYIQDASETCKRVLTNIFAANKLILRDELTHVELITFIIKKLKIYQTEKKECRNTIKIVREFTRNFISYLTVNPIVYDRYNNVTNIMIKVLLKLLQNKPVDLSNYPELTMMRAAVPTLSNFFHDTPSYLTGKFSNIKSVKIII